MGKHEVGVVVGEKDAVGDVRCLELLERLGSSSVSVSSGDGCRGSFVCAALLSKVGRNTTHHLAEGP